MRRLLGIVAAVTAGLVAGVPLTARADTAPVVAWIELAPGSSASNPTTANFGDAPTSSTPTILARAVFDDVSGGCPSMSVDGQSFAMTRRFVGTDLTSTPGTKGATNSATDKSGNPTGYPQYFVNPANAAPVTFPDGTPQATLTWGECEAVVPPGHTLASIGGVDLKLPVAHPRRILVIADTGCRMNGNYSAATNGNQQNCHDPAAFPLAYLSTVEASFKPDLVVHVGDYFYRDTNCRNFVTGCADPTNPAYETWGDTFDSWDADLLFPAKPLLQAAPWVMIRGNHESCGRGARGWFALLDPHPYSAANVTCAKTAAYPAPNGTAPTYNADFTPTYVVPVGGVDLIAFDSSFANDAAVDANTAANYDLDLTAVLNALGLKATAIFATHKPTFGLVSGSTSSGSGGSTVSTGGDQTEQAVFNGGTYAASAFSNGVPASIGLFLSGHVHQLQYLDFKDYTRFAPQLIVGVGGDLLDPSLNTGVAPNGYTNVPTYTLAPNPQQQVQVSGYVAGNGGTVADQDLTKAFTQDEFGFAVLDAVTDKAGATTGYNANVFKISAARSGLCKITLVKARNIVCGF